MSSGYNIAKIYRNECKLPFSSNQSSVMLEAFTKVNSARRRTSDYVFDVYFNVVAANLTYEGGWVPYVNLIAPPSLLAKRELILFIATPKSRLRWRCLTRATRERVFNLDIWIRYASSLRTTSILWMSPIHLPCRSY